MKRPHLLDHRDVVRACASKIDPNQPQNRPKSAAKTAEEHPKNNLKRAVANRECDRCRGHIILEVALNSKF